jgi:sterol desaturase/sphingolipid hydroxylase (fatty acid hydroxylase superfamily)
MRFELFTPTVGAYVWYCVGFCLRYFAIAGGLYGIFHVWFGRRSLVYRIQRTFPSLAEIGHEIRWSMSNTACTGVSTLLLYWLVREQRTHMYFAVGERGWPYFVASVVLGVAGYDAWFYWQHRLLHTPWLFRRAHAIHHRVANPTPFATFAHHPIETLMGNAYFILFVLLIPVHPLALGLVGVIIFAFGIVGHLGYELYPDGFADHPVLGWLNTSTHHNMHHSHAACNYGLCFNYWDRLMETNHLTYRRTFDAITARRAPLRAPAAITLPRGAED